MTELSCIIGRWDECVSKVCLACSQSFLCYADGSHFTWLDHHAEFCISHKLVEMAVQNFSFKSAKNATFSLILFVFALHVLYVQ